jgi:hypothetical protein
MTAIMKALLTATATGLLLCGIVLAAEPAWNPSAIKECNRACLVDFMNRYMDAIYKHDPKAVRWRSMSE